MGNGQVRSLTLEIWILSHISHFKVHPFTLQFGPGPRDLENEMGSWLALKVPFSPLFTHLYYVCTAVKCSLCPTHSLTQLALAATLCAGEVSGARGNV